MTANIPTDDLIAHEPDDCPCGPALIPVVRGDGTPTQIVIHRRLDGQPARPTPLTVLEGWVPDTPAGLG